jgi:hypothetical protein
LSPAACTVTGRQSITSVWALLGRVARRVALQRVVTMSSGAAGLLDRSIAVLGFAQWRTSDLDTHISNAGGGGGPAAASTVPSPS